MPYVARCCFLLNLKDATLVIAFVSMAISLGGITTALLHVCNFFKLPDDKLAIWMLQVVFFLGVHGIVFQAIFILISNLLFWGSLKAVPPLLLPYVCFVPFVVIAIVVNMVLVLEREPVEAPPTVCFGIVVSIFLIYAAFIICLRYKELCRTEERWRFLEGVTQSVHGRINPFQRFTTLFRRHESNSAQPVIVLQTSSPPPGASTGPQPQSPADREEMREMLSHTYAKMLMSSQPIQPPTSHI